MRFIISIIRDSNMFITILCLLSGLLRDETRDARFEAICINMCKKRVTFSDEVISATYVIEEGHRLRLYRQKGINIQNRYAEIVSVAFSNEWCRYLAWSRRRPAPFAPIKKRGDIRDAFERDIIISTMDTEARTGRMLMIEQLEDPSANVKCHLTVIKWIGIVLILVTCMSPVFVLVGRSRDKVDYEVREFRSINRTACVFVKQYRLGGSTSLPFVTEMETL